MANNQRGKFAPDGFRELYAKQEAGKKLTATGGKQLNRRKAKEREDIKILMEERARKIPSTRSTKTLFPGGTGKRNIGRFR